MAATTSSFSCVLLVCLLIAVSSGLPQRREAGAEPQSIMEGPLNTANLQGVTSTLKCTASQTGSPRVQWWEYVTTPVGSQISDGNTLLPGHPNYLRYTLTVDEVQQKYDLGIATEMLDAGKYQCRDLNDGAQGYFADLVTIERNPNCTTTIPANGIVTEGEYHTVECQVFFRAREGIAPLLRWSGPDSFTQGYLTANNSAWAGASLTVNKSMDGKYFTCLTNFSTDGFGGADTATNAPTWSYTYYSAILFVQYGPQNISYSPVQTSHEIGQVLTCNADSVPLSTYTWTNMITMIDYYSQTLTITEDMVGFLMLRCQAVNSVSSANLFINTTVNPRTTSTSEQPPSTSTTVAPVAKCTDLTGRWEAKRSPTSTVVLCLNIDASQNGLIRGLLQNDTNEPYMTELIGRTRNYEYDESGWTGIWPERIGVSSYAAECHACFGIELMQVTLISRSSLDSEYCDGGTVQMSEQYTFSRKPLSYPCSAKMADTLANLAHANDRRLR